MAAPLSMLIWPGMPADEALDAVEERIGVRVEAVAIATNEQLEERLRAGERYDVVCPSDYMVERLAARGELLRLDDGLLPGRAHLAAWARDPVYDPGERFSVPLAFGTSGYLYDRELLPGAGGWSALFDPPAGVEVGMLGELREVIGAALLASGLDLNAADEGSLARAEELLAAQARAGAVRRFDSDDFVTPVTAGLVAAHHAWSGPASVAVRGVERLDYAVPREGAVLWVTTAAIPAGCERPELAHAAIEALLDPAIARRTVEANGYATPNAAARALLAPELRDDPVLFPDEQTVARCSIVRDLGAAADRRLERLWERVSRAVPSRPAG